MLTVTTPAESHRLTTLASVKGELRLTGGGDDEFLLDMIDRASAVIRRWCNRSLALEAVREVVRSTNPAPTLLLSRWPVVSVTSVAIGTTDLADTEYEAETDNGMLYRLTAGDSRCPWPVGKITIDYQAGYVLPGQPGRTLPDDIERAAIMLVKAGWFSRTRDPLVRSEDVAGVMSTSFWVGGFTDGASLPPDVGGLLSPHRQPALG